MSAVHNAGVPTLIASVQRALRLLEAVGSHSGGAPAKQLAREAGLPLPTAYHLLRTLTHEGYLRRESGVFVLGDAAVRLAGGGLQQKRRSMILDSLAHFRDAVGAPVYFAVYREGEIEVVGVSDTPDSQACEEWADFRETAHAHAVGQCLLGQLDEKTRKDHYDRHPVGPITPYTVRDLRSLEQRFGAPERLQAVTERQEYALGTVCAAIPIPAGETPATVAISLPLSEEGRLLSAVEQLRREVGARLSTLMFSISI
ncbi:IclR family transcriptional regulator [Streptomyces sp. NPDC058674]|uniref:IclR family transcriptional regulator n=1 Tax=Streptomyces sp. NPDC058674 TaxID=3346592 RepID=UPI00364F6ECF